MTPYEHAEKDKKPIDSHQFVEVLLEMRYP